MHRQHIAALRKVSLAFIAISAALIIIELSGSLRTVFYLKSLTRFICHQQILAVGRDYPEPFRYLYENSKIFHLFCLRCWGIYSGFFLFIIVTGMLNFAVTDPRLVSGGLAVGTVSVLFERFVMASFHPDAKFISGFVLGIGMGLLLNGALSLSSENNAVTIKPKENVQ